MRRIHVRTLLGQIGRANFLAISGGRVRAEGMDADGYADKVMLQVGNGYRVDVTLDANDTYTVSRVFSRAGKDFAKGTVTGVYCDQVGETAYQASSFRSYEFGEAA